VHLKHAEELTIYTEKKKRPLPREEPSYSLHNAFLIELVRGGAVCRKDRDVERRKSNEMADQKSAIEESSLTL
ncbi:unnamed protein product, partial [Linum tenue]